MRRRTLRFFVLLTATLFSCVGVLDEAQSEDGFDTRAWGNFAVPAVPRDTYAPPAPPLVAQPVGAQPNWNPIPANNWHRDRQAAIQSPQRNIADDLLQSKHRYEPPMPWIFPRDEITIKPAPPMPAIISAGSNAFGESIAPTTVTSGQGPHAVPGSQITVQPHSNITSNWSQPDATPNPPQAYSNQTSPLQTSQPEASSHVATLDAGYAPDPAAAVAPASVQPIRQAPSWDSATRTQVEQTHQTATLSTLQPQIPSAASSDSELKQTKPTQEFTHSSASTNSPSNSKIAKKSSSSVHAKSKNKSKAKYWAMFLVPLILFPVLVWALWPDPKEDDAANVKPARESRTKKARTKALEARKKSRVQAAEKVMTPEEKSIAEKLQLDFGQDSAESKSQEKGFVASVRNILETTKYKSPEPVQDLPPIESAFANLQEPSIDVAQPVDELVEPKVDKTEPVASDPNEDEADETTKTFANNPSEDDVDETVIKTVANDPSEDDVREASEPPAIVEQVIEKTVPLTDIKDSETASLQSQEGVSVEKQAKATTSVEVDAAPSKVVNTKDRPRTTSNLLSSRHQETETDEAKANGSNSDSREPSNRADTDTTQPFDAPPVKLDDFTKLGGIDVVLQQVLYNSGYFEYEDLKYADAKDLQQIVDTLDRQPLFNVGDWSRRAAFAQRQDWKGLKEYRRITEVGAAAGFGPSLKSSTASSVSEEVDELNDALDGSSADTNLESSLLEVAKAMVEKGSFVDPHAPQKTN